VIDTSVPATNAALKPTGNVTLNGGADGQINNTSVTTIAGSTGNWEIRVNATIAPSSSENFGISYFGDSNYGGAFAASSFVNVIIPEFSINVPGPLVLTAGQSGTLQINIVPTSTISSPVTLSCNGNLPVGYSCTLQPTTVNLINGASATATLTLSPLPAGQSVAAVHKSAFFFPFGSDLFSSNPFWRISITTGLAALTLLLCPYRRKLFRPSITLAAVCLISLMFGCGGGGGGGTSPLGGGGSGGGGGTPAPSTTTTTVSTSASPVAQGTPVTFTAKVAGPGNPTGPVGFYLSGSWYGQASLATGTATLQTSVAFPGIFALTASYSGDSSNFASSSAPVNQLVTGTTVFDVQGQTSTLFHFVNVTATVQ
jgi:hypothetical protein